MYKKQKHIHFIGIGGIGMSGIAEILKMQGYRVSGCDVSIKSPITDRLKKLGCPIFENHDPSHIDIADIIVYSSAVDQNNSEVAAAIRKGIPVIPRAIMLAEIMRTKDSVAIAGSHGKTTTTSIISHILLEAKKDPTIIIGGILKNISSNAHLGTGNLLVAEADESDRSLLYLNPSLAVVTNIDAEHLDTYKDLEDVKDTFKSFLARLPFYGKAIVCSDDPGVRSILPLTHVPTIKYGLDDTADIKGEILELNSTNSTFNVYSISYKQSFNLGQINLNIPGKHNVLNSLAAISLCLELDIPFLQIKSAIESFKGVERRFEFKGTYKNADIFDDYGHHPTEIKNTLSIAKQNAKNKLIVFFQPHRYSRTQKLWDDFISTFTQNQIDELILTDIYPAGEEPIENITSKKLANAIKEKNSNLKISYFASYTAATKHIKSILDKDDLLLTLGAGKVNCVAKELTKME
jgi:UDP-N-acetylmuramate--alanine ligase